MVRGQLLALLLCLTACGGDEETTGELQGNLCSKYFAKSKQCPSSTAVPMSTMSSPGASDAQIQMLCADSNSSIWMAALGQFEKCIALECAAFKTCVSHAMSASSAPTTGGSCNCATVHRTCNYTYDSLGRQTPHCTCSPSCCC